MNKLQQLLKKPTCRFKTIQEMVEDFGPNYMNCIIPLTKLEVLTIMSLFAGKKLYLNMVTYWLKDTFLYNNNSLPVHVSMLTIKTYPKFLSRGEIIRPGMIVTVEYSNFHTQKVVPGTIQNEQGVTTRVLKVIKPSDYLTSDTTGFINKRLVDLHCVATELVRPQSGHTTGKVETMYSLLYKDYKIRAFEISWQLRRATEQERKLYYSQQHGADLVLTGK